jgi:hypothetical protein
MSLRWKKSWLILELKDLKYFILGNDCDGFSCLKNENYSKIMTGQESMGLLRSWRQEEM